MPERIPAPSAASAITIMLKWKFSLQSLLLVKKITCSMCSITRSLKSASHGSNSHGSSKDRDIQYVAWPLKSTIVMFLLKYVAKLSGSSNPFGQDWWCKWSYCLPLQRRLLVAGSVTQWEFLFSFFKIKKKIYCKKKKDWSHCSHYYFQLWIQTVMMSGTLIIQVVCFSFKKKNWMSCSGGSCP